MQRPPAGDRQLLGGHVRAILDREVGEAEEGAAERVRRCLAIGHIPGREAAQALQPIIGRPVERDHVQPLLEQIDEGQEMLAVEAVEIELVRRAVGRRHHCHVMLDQRGEQPRQDHRVGRIGDDHLVEGEQPRLVGQRGGDRGDRIALLAAALDAEALMHLLHEGVEMDATLAGPFDAGEEHVHQHRLAAPDATPEIDAAHRRRPLAERPPQDRSTPGSRLQLFGANREPLDHRALRGIGPQLARGNGSLITGQQVAHLSSAAAQACEASPGRRARRGLPAPSARAGRAACPSR